MSEPEQPGVTPTSQEAGATSDTSGAQTAEGSRPGPDDTDAPQHAYRKVQHAEAGGGAHAGHWDAPADNWPGSPSR
jgi:hypothetical protein